MNNWLKIGLPILIAVLLLVGTVGVTLAVTGGGNFQQVATAYQTGATPNVQYAYGPGYGYGGCPVWHWNGYGGGPGGRWNYND